MEPIEQVDHVRISTAATIVLPKMRRTSGRSYGGLLLPLWLHVVLGKRLTAAEALQPWVALIACNFCLLDIWMPVLNGLEVLEQIAGLPEAVGLKIAVAFHVRRCRLRGWRDSRWGSVYYWTKDMPRRRAP